jgi:hypothetical protein
LFLLFLPHFLGAPQSEGFCSQSERLHSGRDPGCCGEEPGKQKPRSCRAQELARSRAVENGRKEKVKYRNQRFRCGEPRTSNLCRGELRPVGQIPRSALNGHSRSFQVRRNPSRIDAKGGDHFLQADFSVPNPSSDTSRRMLSKPFRKTNTKTGRISACCGTAEFLTRIELKFSGGCGRRYRMGATEDMYGNGRLQALPIDWS